METHCLKILSSLFGNILKEGIHSYDFFIYILVNKPVATSECHNFNMYTTLQKSGVSKFKEMNMFINN